MMPVVKRTAVWLVLVVLGLGSMVACQAEPLPKSAATPLPAPALLRIGVASGAQPLADLVVAPYARHNPQSHLQFIPANSATLLADLAAGQVDAVLLHHLPEGAGFWFNPVAWDALAVVVAGDNSVQGLSRAEVQAVFNGRVTNWSLLGGPEQAVALLSRERGSGTRAIFEQRIMGEQRLSIQARLLESNAALLAAVAATPGGIGYATMGSLADGDVVALRLDDVAPTPATAAAESYPLAMPLYFVSAAEPQGELRLFLAWLQGEAGQAVVAARYGRVR